MTSFTFSAWIDARGGGASQGDCHDHGEAVFLRATFMTAAMWLAWMLRGDVRAGCRTGDVEGQRTFVSWWLLFGQVEYPAVWWYGPEQAEVAMAPDPAFPALPRLLFRLHRSRLDLQAAFDLSDPEQVTGLLCWYRLASARELPAAPPLPPAFLATTERPSARLADATVPCMALALWASNPALQAAIDLEQPGHRKGLARWYASGGAQTIPAAPAPLPWAEIRPVIPRRPRTRGGCPITLAGFARAEFGIGEDVRTLSRALEAVGVAHTIADLRPQGAVRLGDGSRAAWIGGRAAAPGVNIFCVTAFDMADLFLREGLAPFERGYNVGYWPWELPRFPDDWADMYGLVHEVWAATTFQAAAYRCNSPVPVHLMPPCAVPPGRPPRPARAGQAFRFLHPFDPNSTLARKNPIATVKAFRGAFPLSDRGVELVLRVNGRGAGRPGWSALRAAARGDRRIRILEGTLPRARALRMLLAADCLVSPHRAEGLGRNIAEAIALGVPVLATGFSGSRDLLLQRECIAAKLRALSPGEYPFADGQSWAEPDWRRLALQLRMVRRRGWRQAVMVRRARQFASRFGLLPAGQRYAAALARINGSPPRPAAARSARRMAQPRP